MKIFISKWQKAAIRTILSGSLAITLVLFCHGFQEGSNTGSVVFAQELVGSTIINSRSFFQEYTAGTTYYITVTGTVDPENDFVSITNLGDEPIIGAKLVVNGKDWSSIDSILDQIISPEMTDEEKALAIWQFGRENSYHWWTPSWATLEVRDPVKIFNVYGYRFCSDIAAGIAAMFEYVGLPSRFWSVAGSLHAVSEAFYDGQWHMLDVDRDGLYLERDNRTVAGVDDILSDPSLVVRAGPAHADLVTLYGLTKYPDHVEPSNNRYAIGHEISMTLRPKESLILRWHEDGLYHDDTGWSSPTPPLYANSYLISQLDFSDPTYHRWLTSKENLASSADTGDGSYLIPIQTGIPGMLSYDIYSPYPVVSGNLALDIVRTDITDTIEVYADPYPDAFILSEPQFSSGQYRIPDYFVDEGNVNFYANDFLSPPVHSQQSSQISWISYKMRPVRGLPQVVGGCFYRYSENDWVRILISTDSNNWQEVWRTNRLNYHTESVDITSRVANLDYFLIRYEWYASSANWMAGLQSMEIRGVESMLAVKLWSAQPSDPIGKYRQMIDLSAAISPTNAPASYHYRILIRLVSGAELSSSGIGSFVLTSTLQTAPLSLPTLKLGLNTVHYSMTNLITSAALITHSWSEIDGPHNPYPPSAPTLSEYPAQIDATAPFTLSWTPSVDADGDYIWAYHIQICARSDCRWPLSPIFDIINLARAPQLRVDAYDWFNPGQTYYWRVKAFDTSGRWGDYGRIWEFTVVEVPIVGVAINLNGSMIAGQPLQFTARVLSGSNVTYTWDFGDGTQATGSTVAHTYPSSGLYTVTVSAANSLGVLTTATSLQVTAANFETQIWLPLVQVQ